MKTGVVWVPYVLRHPEISRKAKRLSAVPGFKNLSCRYIHAGDVATLLSNAQREETPRLYPDRECPDR